MTRAPSALHVQTSGKPSSAALLLLHGFLGSAKDWAPLTRSLSQCFFCLCPDLPGHGRSIGLDDHAYTWEGVVGLLGNVVQRFGLRAVIPVGYSMGGRIALRLAAERMENLAGVVAEAAHPGIEDDGERERRARRDEEWISLLERVPLRDFLAAWYAQPVFATQQNQPGRMEPLLTWRAQNDPGELARALRGFSTGRQEPLWRQLEGLGLPLLYIAGEADAGYAALAGRMARLSTHFRSVIVPTAGHNVHAERAPAFLAAVSEFAGPLLEGKRHGQDRMD